jgi:hypothetical protein
MKEQLPVLVFFFFFFLSGDNSTNSNELQQYDVFENQIQYLGSKKGQS